MLEVKIPVEASNNALLGGSVRAVIGATLDTIEPEARCFVQDNDGQRRALFSFGLADSQTSLRSPSHSRTQVSSG